MAGGIIGAFLVFIGERGLAWRREHARTKSNKAALTAEVMVCGSLASEYLTAGVKSPLYRLPTSCFQTSVNELLKLGKLSQDGAKALIEFYGEVETLNRGLDLADALYRPGAAVGKDTKDEALGRNALKANRICEPSGDLYIKALAAMK